MKAQYLSGEIGCSRSKLGHIVSQFSLSLQKKLQLTSYLADTGGASLR